MARLTQKVDIEGFEKIFEVKELTVAELIGLFDQVKNLEKGSSVIDMLSHAKDILPLVGNATIKDLQSMAPSEIEKLHDAFMEVNGSFFKVARTVGMGALLSRVRAALLEDCYALFVTAMQEGPPEQSTSLTDIS